MPERQRNTAVILDLGNRIGQLLGSISPRTHTLRTILVESRVVNALKALSLHSAVSKMSASSERTDLLARGHDYLRRNAGRLYSELTRQIDPDDPPELWENFSQLLILEATGERQVSLRYTVSFFL